MTDYELGKELREIKYDLSRIKSNTNNKGHFFILILLICIWIDVTVVDDKLDHIQKFIVPATSVEQPAAK